MRQNEIGEIEKEGGGGEQLKLEEPWTEVEGEGGGEAGYGRFLAYILYETGSKIACRLLLSICILCRKSLRFCICVEKSRQVKTLVILG